MTAREGDGSSALHTIQKGDVPPEGPRLSVELSAASHLSLTLPYQIQFTLRRAQDDAQEGGCIVRWSPTLNGFSPSGFVLLRHVGKEGGLEVVPVDHSGLVKLPEEDAIVINGHNQFLWEFAPGDHVSFVADPPERYYRALRAGETYTLLYPGAELTMWNWGRIKDHIGATMKKEPTKSGHRLVIPGGACITFTAQSEVQEWPEREKVEAAGGFSWANLAERKWRLRKTREESERERRTPSPIGITERVPGTPVFTVTLECPATITRQDPSFEVTIKVKYDGVAGQASTSTTRPVIFHTWALVSQRGDRQGYRLYRSRDKRGSWERCAVNDESSGASLFVDDPDAVVSVTQDDMKSHFVSLSLGEEWLTKRWLQGEAWTNLPKDATPGDIFRYSFKGALVDWWDWGSKDEHKETFVTLPPWIVGKVTSPRDNGGRGSLIVPASEAVEFIMT